MSDITVLIEIKSYLKKYLINQYGSEPVKFPHGHKYNYKLVHSLQKPPFNFKPCFDRENCIEICLPYNNLVNVRTHTYLSIQDKIDLRKAFDDEFVVDYKEYIEKKQRSEKLNRKDATILYFKMNNILETDITFDAIYKAMYRNKVKRLLKHCFSIF